MGKFEYRTQYVNFSDHLLNKWNPNMYFLDAPNRWPLDDWKKYFIMLKNFGFTDFEFWLTPTLYDKPALTGDSPFHVNFVKEMREIIRMAHEVDLNVSVLLGPNCIGHEWYFACPNDKEDKKLIFDLFEFWVSNLSEIDTIQIFPGDPGGCNRNGCNEFTFVDLALELTEKVLSKYNKVPFIGTWGTPFSGWGSDLKNIPNWDGTWAMLTDPKYATPEVPAHIWNGKRERAERSLEYLIKRLKDFPKDTQVVLNVGMDPDSGYTMGGCVKKYAREIAKTNKITTWEYSLAEGELISYPHWRLPNMSSRMREWEGSAPYSGGISYTMSPKLNLLSQYVAGHIMCDTNTNVDVCAGDFFAQVFGEEHRELGELCEAFEVVKGWGHYPRHIWNNENLQVAYKEIIEHLENADASKCTLPIFPDAETYRQDLLWFAKEFLKMTYKDCDREQVRKDYWNRALSIYDYIPMSADPRAELAATNFSKILEQDTKWVDPIS